MRRRLATATLLALTASLAACGSDDPGSDTTTGAEIDGLTVTGEFGKEPTIEVDGLEVTDAESEVVIEGDGDELTEDDTFLYRAVFAKGTDGTTIQSNYGENAPQRATFDGLSPSMREALEGQTVGSRVAIAMQVKELVCGEDAAEDCTGDAPQFDLKGADAVVVVFDLVDQVPAPLDGPEGDTVEPPADAPKAVAEDGDVTAIDFSDAPTDPPTKLQVIPLIEGDGETVKKGDTVTVDYFGAVWGKGDKPFDESYSGDPTSFGLDQVITGWGEGLVGVNVGSRVMLVIPPDQGYGEAGSPPNIPGGATLVFVVDVLGIG